MQPGRSQPAVATIRARREAERKEWKSRILESEPCRFIRLEAMNIKGGLPQPQHPGRRRPPMPKPNPVTFRDITQYGRIVYCRAFDQPISTWMIFNGS